MIQHTVMLELMCLLHYCFYTEFLFSFVLKTKCDFSETTVSFYIAIKKVIRITLHNNLINVW